MGAKNMGERRTEGLSVTLTPSERRAIEAHLAMTGQQASPWLRELAMREIDGKPA